MPVYFVKQGDAIKIGCSQKIPVRFCNLQSSSPSGLELLGAILLDGGKLELELEKHLHDLAGAWHLSGEWFACNPEVIQIIEGSIRSSLLDNPDSFLRSEDLLRNNRLAPEELYRIWAVAEKPKDKLILKLVYEIGCRIGEVVQIQLKHINFQNHSIFFPVENMKTNRLNPGVIPENIMNDLKNYLKSQGRMTKRDENIKKPDTYLFMGRNSKTHITTRAIQKMFQKYVKKAGLDEVCGQDSKGRQLHKYTIRCLRNSHTKRSPKPTNQRLQLELF